MTSTAEFGQKVIKFVQEILLDEDDRTAISPTLILKKIDMVIAMNPKWGEALDREAVTDELIRRFSLWIGQDTTLKSDFGHVQWLSSARKKDWRYWQRYRERRSRTAGLKCREPITRRRQIIFRRCVSRTSCPGHLRSPGRTLELTAILPVRNRLKSQRTTSEDQNGAVLSL